MKHILDFEYPLESLEAHLEALKIRAQQGEEVGSELQKTQTKFNTALKRAYEKLTPWDKVQLARHPNRPHAKDYMNFLLKDMHYLAGDRLFHEDHALIGGIGYLDQSPVMVLGIEKGHDTETRIAHRFGMARPEGYRKAQRLMRLANQFSLPIVTFVDTAGAYPGVEAEARGQSEAIARSIEICLSVEVPLISVIIGEGGSGGAVALATANRILMLEHSIYSVISPEGCASILWRKEAKQEAAQALKLTAQDLQQLGIIDDIIPETLGGAHRDSEKTMDNVGQALRKHLKSLQGLNRSLRQDREEKFEKMTRELGPQK